MTQENKHIDKQNDPDGLSDLFASHAKIPWEKNKAEIWNDLEEQMMKEDRSPVLVRRLLPGRQWLAMAASLVLLLSVSGFMRFYTVKTFCPEGVHTVLQLPDGSEVELNASTQVKHHPYWWFISRQVELEGEAFFHVEKGNKFRVISPHAATEVLGTTFNVFARDRDYIVTCHTGSVKVSETITGNAVILLPNERSTMEPSGGFTVTQLDNSLNSPGWTDNLVMFTSTPLRLVFEEIERQFGIVIEAPVEMQQVYSGNFSLDQPVENILFLLCLPFDLEYERQTGKNIWSTLPRNKVFLFLLVLLCSQVRLYGQKIEIYVIQEPLNQVLIELASDYRVQLSFDDYELSAYIVTVQSSFSNPEEAITFLIKDLPLEYRQIGEVFTIYRKHLIPPEKNYHLAGRVVDSESGETLPYSHVVINQSGVISDFNGNFAYISTDSLFELSISYLGYYIKDTTLAPGSEYVLELTPSIIGLEEVVVEGSTVERSGQTGEEAGVIRLNHKIAYRLPGNGDNAIFNFLRLQPGILAAGERSSELIIWGSYSGHSKIMFDGFTVFGLKNFNDNIAFVNPYLAKDIKVLKGGFSSDYDNRVGGIVDISGFNGSTQKPSINLNINNMTANGMVSIPIAKRSAITFAYRQTYYNLYDAEDLNIITRNTGRGNSGQTDVNVYPDYVFRDMNLKYAGSFKSGDDYFISLYGGRDKFSFDIDQERNNSQIDYEAEEGNLQRGATAFFGKTWKKGWNSHFSFSASGLEREVYETQLITRNSGNSIIGDREVYFYNSLLDLTLKNKNFIPLSKKQSLEAGWNYTHEGTQFGRGQQEDNSLEITEEDSHRIGLYVQDEIRLTPGLSIKPGIRVDYSFFVEKVYFQPRIQASLDLSDHWRVNASAGIYRQFISEISVIDELGNFRYFWSLCDNVAVPVLKANHVVGGINFHTTGFSADVESFYKTTDGISRYKWIDGTLEVAQGNARSYGMDLLLKKYFKKHEVWASYTLSLTEEHFNSMPEDVYNYAPQDQRHEVKGALLLNFKPFFFSANYVYGSGFRPPSSMLNNLEERYPYSRLDMAVFYRLNVKSYHFEAGISILNVLNQENIKYSNVIHIPDTPTSNIRIHAEAVPFTPTIYLNMAF